MSNFCVSRWRGTKILPQPISILDNAKVISDFLDLNFLCITNKRSLICVTFSNSNSYIYTTRIWELTNIPWSHSRLKKQMFSQAFISHREKRIEKKITIRRTESPAPQRTGSSQSLPRPGSSLASSSPAFNKSTNQVYKRVFYPRVLKTIRGLWLVRTWGMVDRLWLRLEQLLAPLKTLITLPTSQRKVSSELW